MKTKELSKENLVKKNMSKELIDFLHDINEESCGGVNCYIDELEKATHFFLSHLFLEDFDEFKDKITHILIQLAHTKDAFAKLRMPELDPNN
ncbi:hypothetical protein ACUNWD_03855 [Sunxiuqinia sp. A32]|uniref:hypothetical protein n=1 Tax=Sunxiuqinia sp. A32 TaxID=3461496 RepID=UPI004046749A